MTKADKTTAYQRNSFFQPNFLAGPYGDNLFGMGITVVSGYLYVRGLVE